MPECSTNWSFICERPWPLSGEERMNCVHIYPWSDTEPAEGHLLIVSRGPQVEPAKGPAQGATVQCGAGWNLGLQTSPAHPQVLDLPIGTSVGSSAHKVPPGAGSRGSVVCNLVLPLGEDHLGTMPPAPGKGSREANTYSLCTEH